MCLKKIAVDSWEGSLPGTDQFFRVALCFLCKPHINCSCGPGLCLASSRHE